MGKQEQSIVDKIFSGIVGAIVGIIGMYVILLIVKILIAQTPEFADVLIYIVGAVVFGLAGFFRKKLFS